MSSASTPSDRPAVSTAERRALMALSAEATHEELSAAFDALGRPEHGDLRAPEIGLVMLRGRTGGDGAPFNLGEATVTRAAVRLGSGHVGYAYLLGRDPARARLAAVLDAVQQSGGTAAIERCFADPVRRRIAHDRARGAARTAATRVDFFTLVRGED
ncbi:phosphonate C-P lyase system protein PhnG [uncultured Alsobacter sp.]|uniref:phosphonate C-P lyase system protein PhnG n=1 Tax=uncultured Alsobacter sp. TaxID=1748258 RepID=UPI0025EDAEDF|nr:phosphonate C-P lyase system protein PhnG [uncultured Alsobacter sp.]